MALSTRVKDGDYIKKADLKEGDLDGYEHYKTKPVSVTADGKETEEELVIYRNKDGGLKQILTSSSKPKRHHGHGHGHSHDDYYETRTTRTISKTYETGEQKAIFNINLAYKPNVTITPEARPHRRHHGERRERHPSRDREASKDRTARHERRRKEKALREEERQGTKKGSDRPNSDSKKLPAGGTSDYDSESDGPAIEPAAKASSVKEGGSIKPSSIRTPSIQEPGKNGATREPSLRTATLIKEGSVRNGSVKNGYDNGGGPMREGSVVKNGSVRKDSSVIEGEYSREPLLRGSPQPSILSQESIRKSNREPSLRGSQQSSRNSNRDPDQIPPRAQSPLVPPIGKSRPRGSLLSNRPDSLRSGKQNANPSLSSLSNNLSAMRLSGNNASAVSLNTTTTASTPSANGQEVDKEASSQNNFVGNPSGSNYSERAERRRAERNAPYLKDDPQ
ncbi:hypothetical protein SBOR_1235 [Sclerotinia borealis F-4128]|uniref:Uncharacterized protein n=1 Tax=Sclerotinia borealis (strain F-4128) TaxID=1432307 RepID=W9CNL0_SCLBF|nr:hypothetical protein SBOR_1235 [Sclerotinia borealis F-4128]